MLLGPVSWIVLAPALGACALMFVPKHKTRLIHAIGMLAVSVSLALAIDVFVSYDRTAGGYQFVDRIDWVPSLGIAYHMGADGISAVLLLMTGILAFSGVFVSMSVKVRVKEFFIFYLFLIAGCFGTFAALNIFFIYFFYETAVVPVFPLIGVWGSGNKEYATMKLTLYLTFGAVLALVAILGLYFAVGLNTFALPAIEAALAELPKIE